MIARRAFLVLAILAGAVAALAYWYDARRVGVIVAARPIEAESVVLPEDLGEIELPPSAVPAGAFSRRADIVGRTIRSPLESGQLLLHASFTAPPGFRSGLRPPRGWRAVALPVSPVLALGGALSPGARVDVVAVPLAGRAPAERGPERIAEGAVVLDVRSEDGGPFVTPGSHTAGTYASTRLGSVVIAIPVNEDLLFAERIASSTFVLFRSP